MSVYISSSTGNFHYRKVDQNKIYTFIDVVELYLVLLSIITRVSKDISHSKNLYLILDLYDMTSYL
jgi:hypothetical protein